MQKTITQLNTMIENQDRAQKEAEARKKLEEDAKAHAAKAANDLSDVQAELKELRAAAAKAKKQAELDEIERLKQEAVASATKQVKEDAEKAAAEKAKKTLEEHEKAIKKVKDAEEEAKKAKKEAEEEAKKLKPPPEDSQPPIKFKDAVGRKFSFPWRHCKTWKVSLWSQSILAYLPDSDVLIEGSREWTISSSRHFCTWMSWEIKWRLAATTWLDQMVKSSCRGYGSTS